MPEAAMNKNHGFVFRQDDVGAARQFAVVQAEAITHSVEHRTHYHLRLGVFAGDAAHVPASPGLRETVFGFAWRPGFQFNLRNLNRKDHKEHKKLDGRWEMGDGQ